MIERPAHLILDGTRCDPIPGCDAGIALIREPRREEDFAPSLRQIRDRSNHDTKLVSSDDAFFSGWALIRQLR